MLECANWTCSEHAQLAEATKGATLPMPSLVCPQCQQEFHVYACEVPLRTHCSVACRWQAARAPLPDLAEHFWAQVNKHSGHQVPYVDGECWLWIGRFQRPGYGAVNLCRFRKTGTREGRAHRIAWELTHGPVPDGLFVLHHCDTPACVRPSHLFVGSQLANRQDASQKQRVPHGEAVWVAKLTAAQVQDIRRLRQAGTSTYRLALDFSVTRGTISAVVRRLTWKHV